MSSGADSLGRRLARGVVRRRGLMLALWAVAAAVLLPFSAGVERELEVAARVAGSEATDVDRELRERFRSPFANNVVLVMTGVPAPDDPRGLAVLDTVVRAVRAVPGITGSFSWRDLRDSLFLPGGGVSGTLIVFGVDASRGPVDATVPPLRRVTERLSAQLRDSFPDNHLRWTGEVAINHDLRRTSAAEVSAAEAKVLPLTLIALVIAFGAVAAAFLPVLAGILAISITLGAAVLIARQWPLSILLQNTASMIGFGVGIDYALLTLSRFRESLAGGADVKSAAEEAAHHAGGTIAISGVAVMIGFSALLLTPLNELQSIAVGGLLVVGISMLMAMTLLPAVLAFVGRRIEFGRLWRQRTGASEWWRRWGRWVAGHPWRALLVAVTPLLLLAWQSRRINADIPRGNWLPASMESAQGLDDLEHMGRTGVVNTVRVVLELPPGVSVMDGAGWTATRRLTELLMKDPMTARVRSVTAIVPGTVPNMMMYSMIPAAVRQTLVSEDGRAALLDVMPVAADFTDLTNFARRLRLIDATTATGVPGARVRVGGLPAFNADYNDAIQRVFVRVVLLVVLATLVTLIFVFRSILVPIKAVVLNLLSVAAAFGAVVLVFQDGYGSRLLGLNGPMAGVFPVVPILVFCIVFGLSMDYEIFLVARVAEARQSGLGEDEALAEALARTGGVITSAAAIMILVFAAFTMGEFLLTKILGFALAVAVLLDATLVRMVVGPALLRLAGRWNWWPGSR